MTSPPKRIRVTFDVATQSQAAELNAAWVEIVARQRSRLNTAVEDVNEIMERARTALKLTTNAIETNPGTRAIEALGAISRRCLQRQRLSQFLRVTCRDCQSLVLEPSDDSA
jgi:hypothetical protein